MKEFKGIGLFFAICIAGALLLLIGLWIGKETSIRGTQPRADGAEKSFIGRDILKNGIVEKIGVNDEVGENAEVSLFTDVSSNSERLSRNTEFLVWQKDLRTGEVVELKEELPQKYLGMDFSAFLSAVERYNQAPPLTEREKGFAGMEILRFSGDLVLAQKNYQRALPNEGFYLALMDRRVVVLLEDKCTIYMNTDISLHMLPQELQEALSDMIYVENEPALFDFLEAYSS